jgi:hypothetical protein
MVEAQENLGTLTVDPMRLRGRYCSISSATNPALVFSSCLLPCGGRQRGNGWEPHLAYSLNAKRERQATVPDLQAGQELLSATLFPVGQQNSDHVLFEKLKNGNPHAYMPGLS